MKIGMSTWSLLSMSLTDAIKKIGEEKFQSIEIWGEIPHGYHEVASPKKVKDALSTFGMEVTAHAPFHDLNPGCTYHDVSATTLKSLSSFVEFSRQIGVTQVTFHPGSTYDASLVDRSINSASLLFKQLAQLGGGTIDMNIENQYADKTGYSFNIGGRDEWLSKVLRSVDGLGMTIDTGHANVNREDPAVLLETYEDAVRNVHLNNNRGLADEHNLPSEGTADLAKFMKAAKKVRDITVTLELNPFRYRPKEVLAVGRAALGK
ncbi:MAG: sugar phosphate isomerase/epimerase [Nitrososphaerota archaeon]|nr:sugar phosphate isomerase/epimerase [Nitrososphaerota archaeon]MDG6938951.1 sugar phosphate isomerase/epimerase [Nitrososphaerota archaeon]